MSISTDMMTARESRAAHARGAVSAAEIARECVERIKTNDGEIHSFLGVYDDIDAQAAAADARNSGDAAPALTGVPVAVKDNILVAGETASAGSRMLASYAATYDATAIARLRDAGAVLIGRTNMDEFAMGSSTEYSAFGPTKNPRALHRVPGGSSGGSAAAVAAGLVPLALGSDTGGSIRQPASFCGVVGLKPTYGRVSRFGLIAMGSSLDCIGPLARTVTDAELLFTAIAGHDPKDSTSLPDGAYPPVSAEAKRIGVPRSFLAEHLSESSAAVFDAALDRFAHEGYEIVDVVIPELTESLAAYYIIMFAESSTNLSRFDGIRYGLHADAPTLLDEYKRSRADGFGREVLRRIMLGTYVLSAGYYDAYYGRATALRRRLSAAFADVFSRVDVLAMPTTPEPAFRAGEKEDPVSMYLTDVFTVPANLTGVPALSVPMGTVSSDGDEMPIGLQMMAPAGGEARLFALGKQFTGENQ